MGRPPGPATAESDDDRPYNLHDVVKRSGRDYAVLSRVRKRLGIGVQRPNHEWRFTEAEAAQLSQAFRHPAPPPALEVRPVAYTGRAVARMLGVDQLTIAHWCKHLGIPRGPGVRMTAAQVDALAALRDAGGLGHGRVGIGRTTRPAGRPLPPVPAADVRAALRAARPGEPEEDPDAHRA